jgi:hypothetical protein
MGGVAARVVQSQSSGQIAQNSPCVQTASPHAQSQSREQSRQFSPLSQMPLPHPARGEASGNGSSEVARSAGTPVSVIEPVPSGEKPDSSDLQAVSKLITQTKQSALLLIKGHHEQVILKFGGQRHSAQFETRAFEASADGDTARGPDGDRMCHNGFGTQEGGGPAV